MRWCFGYDAVGLGTTAQTQVASGYLAGTMAVPFTARKWLQSFLDGAVDVVVAGRREVLLGKLVWLVVGAAAALVVAVAEIPHRCQAFHSVATRKWWWHSSASMLSSDTGQSLWRTTHTLHLWSKSVLANVDPILLEWFSLGSNKCVRVSRSSQWSHQGTWLTL